MYFKIAIKNIISNYKNYLLYFLTLLLSISIFITFNSLNANALLNDSPTAVNIIKIIQNLLKYISIIVSLILLFLMLYANKIQIKRRNAEFAKYLLLGMQKSSLSRILIYETFSIGLLALLIGIALAYPISYVFQFVVFNLLELPFKFNFNTNAIYLTIIIFIIIFILISIINISKLFQTTIINILNTENKQEVKEIKYPYIKFCLSIICLVSSYIIGIKNGINFNYLFTLTLILGILGTVLFYNSFTTILLKIIKKTKFYLHTNIMIIVNQINQNIKSQSLTISIISLLLLLSFLLISTSFGYKNTIDLMSKNAAPVDISIVSYDENVNNPIQYLENNGIDLSNDNIIDFTEYQYFKPMQQISNLDNKIINQIKPQILSLSTYNKLTNQKISLQNNEAILTTGNKDIGKILKKYTDISININDVNYKIKDTNYNVVFYNDFVIENQLTLILPDQNINNMVDLKLPSISIINVDFNDDKSNNEANLISQIDLLNKKTANDENSFYFLCYGHNQLILENRISTATILLILFYLSIIFIITSLALMALNEFNAILDNKNNYLILYNLGLSMKQINKIIFQHVLTYFIIPLILLIVNGIIGIKIITDFLAVFNKPNILPQVIIVISIMLILYLIYLFITYLLGKNFAKNMINSKYYN